MRSWKARLLILLTILAMFAALGAPAMAQHDPWLGSSTAHPWDCDDDDDDGNCHEDDDDGEGVDYKHGCWIFYDDDDEDEIDEVWCYVPGVGWVELD